MGDTIDCRFSVPEGLKVVCKTEKYDYGVAEAV
jgi:hypothetical protein